MYFVDTSALLKIYVEEKGSNWIRTQVRYQFAVSMITYPEIYSAITRRTRKGTVALQTSQEIFRAFEHDMDQRYWLIEVDRALCQKAALLAHKHALRGYDSVQLACALKVNGWLLNAGSTAGITFLSADQELLQAAHNEGLTVTNPEDHA